MQPPKFHGLITIDSSNNAIRVGVDSGGGYVYSTVTIASGDYFIRSHGAGGDTSQLVETIQAAINGVAGASCTVSGSDLGFVSVRNNHGANTLAIVTAFNAATTALWQTILGYIGTFIMGPGATVAASNQHKFGWYPNVPIVDETGHPSALSPYESDARVTVAPDGTGTTTRYAERQLRRFEIRNVADDYTFPVGTPLVVNRDYEQFWRDVLAPGRRWRLYQDRTVQLGPTGGVPEVFYGEQTTAQRGTSAGVSREAADWARLWMVAIDARVYV